MQSEAIPDIGYRISQWLDCTGICLSLYRIPTYNHFTVYKWPNLTFQAENWSAFLREREKILYTYSRPISAFTKTILMKKAMQFLAALGVFVQISSAYHQHSWFEIPNAFETPRDRFTFQKVHSKLLLVDKNTNKCQLGCEVFSEKYLSLKQKRSKKIAWIDPINKILKKKFVDIAQQCSVLLLQVNFPANNLNFHR